MFYDTGGYYVFVTNTDGERIDYSSTDQVQHPDGQTYSPDAYAAGGWIEGNLISLGMERRGDGLMFAEQDVGFSNGAVYEDSKRACDIDVNQVSLIFTCVDVSKAQVIGPQYGQFYEAWEADGRDSSNIVLMIDLDDIEAGGEGYEIASGGGSNVEFSHGFMTVFYRKVGGDWAYSYGGHSVPSCVGDFETLDERRALVDDVCEAEIDGEWQTTTVGEFYGL